ncbi:hypothetical protein A4X03_0g3874 [Tilletia caries]|uniref:Ubiquitin-like protease family profile domain-containing protein n=1 Tax=Tilletia caries TaxID=13290 RepID=A0A8T8TGT7_9BASI|nr:hypothetical protein A4X03_0g3874 [Tilletia caries]
MSSASQSDPFSRPHSPGGFSIDEEEEEEEEPASEDEEAMRRNDEHNQSILQAVLQSRGAWAPSQNRLQGLTQRKSSKQKKEKWRLVTTCNTQHLYQWFESQFNDYSSHDLSTVPWVNLTWMGHPGDSPRDLSARPWFVQFGAGVNNNSKDIATLSRKETARIVVRAHFRCLGRCVPHPVGGDEEEEDETETDADADESESKIPENSKGAAYLSANVTAASIGSLLTALQKEVMEEVERICDLGEKELNQLRKRDPQLVKRAADIQKRGAWQPAGVMIDKCTAELNAIKTVWPEVQVRLCQFHAIQAIGRWDTDSTQNLKNRKSPGISIAQKLLICIAFREAQRCRDGAEWSQFQTAFEKEVNSILARCTAAVRKQVVSYFRENWWNDTWRGSTKAGVKPAKEAASQPDDPKANNIPSGTSAGRPAAAQPMQPSRSKTGSSLRFSQKPGKRPKAKADILREYYSQQTVQGVQGASSPSCDESTPQSATTAAEASTANPAQPKNPIPTYEEQIQGIIRKLDSEAAGIQLPGSKISTWLVGTDFKAFLSQQWLTGTLIALWCELVRLHYHVNPRKRPLDFQGEPVEPTRTCLTSVTLFTETWDEVVMKHRIEDMEQGSLLSQDKLVCPLHLGTNHWATAVVDVGKKTVTVINSIPNEAQAKSVLAFFQEFLPRRAEHEIGKGLLAVGRGSQPDDWILATDPAAESEYPRQRDNSSCGVVTCAVILAVAKGEAPTWQNCGYKEQYISIEEADKFRRKLLSHLVPHIRFVDSKPAEK